MTKKAISEWKQALTEAFLAALPADAPDRDALKTAYDAWLEEQYVLPVQASDAGGDEAKEQVLSSIASLERAAHTGQSADEWRALLISDEAFNELTALCEHVTNLACERVKSGFPTLDAAAAKRLEERLCTLIESLRAFNRASAAALLADLKMDAAYAAGDSELMSLPLSRRLQNLGLLPPR